MAGEHGAEGADHVGGGEQAAVLGDEQQKIPGQPLDLELLQDGGERSALLLGGEDRALDQPRKVVEGIERVVEAVKVGGDLVERVCFEGKLEQRGGIAPATPELVSPRPATKAFSSRTGARSSRLVPGPRK